MRAGEWLRLLSPRGWVSLAVGLVVVLAVLHLLSDPLGVKGRRLEQAQAVARQGQMEARARQIERAATVDQARHQATIRDQVQQARDATATAVAEARGESDAQTSLGDLRRQRLSGHDRQLCGFRPELDGCATAAAAAAGG